VVKARSGAFAEPAVREAIQEKEGSVGLSRHLPDKAFAENLIFRFSKARITWNSCKLRIADSSSGGSDIGLSGRETRSLPLIRGRISIIQAVLSGGVASMSLSAVEAA